MKCNNMRPGCVDVFHASLVKYAKYDGEQEIPIIAPCASLPSSMRPFSQAIRSRCRKGWVHFYEDDAKFERIWRQPERYLKALAEFEGVITPDFSVYRDMPKVMQDWNIYRSRAFGYALQQRGGNVVVNFRAGDERSCRTACLGAPRHASIAIGTHGNLKDPEDRKHLILGINYAVEHLEPKTLIVYGAAPPEIFDKYVNQGIELLRFESTFAQTHKQVR